MDKGSNADQDYILMNVQATNLSIPSFARECCRDYMVERPERGGAGSSPAVEAARAAGAKLGLGVIVPGIYSKSGGRENAEGTTWVPGSISGVSSNGGVAQWVEQCFLYGIRLAGFRLSPDRRVVLS